MKFAAKLEELSTGEVSILFFNKSESWEKLFPSIPIAAKEAEKLGVFDSATRRLFEHVTDAGYHGYLAPQVELRPELLFTRGFRKQST